MVKNFQDWVGSMANSIEDASYFNRNKNQAQLNDRQKLAEARLTLWNTLIERKGTPKTSLEALRFIQSYHAALFNAIKYEEWQTCKDDVQCWEEYGNWLEESVK